MRPNFLLSLTAAAVLTFSLAACSDKPEPVAEAPKLPPGVIQPEGNLQKGLKVAPVATSRSARCCAWPAVSTSTSNAWRASAPA